MPAKQYTGPMSVGEIVVRHLWCCVAHDAPVGTCDNDVIIDVPKDRVVRALWSVTSIPRRDVLSFAKMGPDVKHPYTGLCVLARKYGVRPSDLRQQAKAAARQLTDLLDR